MPQGEGTPHVRKLSNPRVPKIMLEGGLCMESERAIAAVLVRNNNLISVYSPRPNSNLDPMGARSFGS